MRSLLLGLSLGVVGCTGSFAKNEFAKGQKLQKDGDLKGAFDRFNTIVLKTPDSSVALDAARQASRIAFYELKTYDLVIPHFKFIILRSTDSQERIETQKKIAETYFDKLKDYPSAIREFNKLLIIGVPRDEEFNYRFNIAKSYFQINNFYQTETELNSLLEKFKDPDRQFDVSLFKGNVYLTTKEHLKAIQVFEELIEKFPAKAAEQNISLNLASVYEDLQNFDKAMGILRQLRSSEKSPEFIDLKIKRLQERARNLPGARGFTK